MIDYLSVEGSPEMMGLAHGEHFKKKILFLLNERNSILFDVIPKLTYDRLNYVCQLQYNYFKNKCPQLDREVSSIARASGLKPFQLIQAGGYTDLIDILSPTGAVNISECSITINPVKGFIAGTWDSHPSAIEGLILLKRNPTNSNVKTLALSTAGWPAQQGINSSGVAFSITNLTPTNTCENGMNYISANAFMSTCSSITDFLDFANDIKFSSGHSYLMLDSNGKGCSVETNAKTINTLYFRENYIMTNHYQVKPLIDNNSNYKYVKGSIDRYCEMEEISKKISTPESFSVNMCLSEYINKKDINDISMTCAHFYLVPKKQEVYVSKGPCTGKNLVKFKLE